MDEVTERERLSQGYDDEGDGPPAAARLRARYAPPPGWWWAFAAGLLVGWFVIGWWLWPVAWTDALPADLNAADRTAYVQMVADAYVRRPDADTAAGRLASFPADVLTAVLDAQGANADDPVAAENARQLKRGLVAAGRLGGSTAAGEGAAGGATGGRLAGTGSQPSAADASGVGTASVVTTTTTPARAGGLQRLTQPAFWLGLIALLALAAIAVAVLRQPRPSPDDVRTRAKVRRRARLAARGHGLGETGALWLEEADRPSSTDEAIGDDTVDSALRSGPQGGGPPGAAERSGRQPSGRQLSPRQPGTRPPGNAPQRTGRLGLPELPPDDTAALQLPRALWQRSGEAGLGPGKLDFGTAASVLYDGADEHFYQTWLVYDEREGLSASINIQARKVGSLTSLDVWLYDRDVTGESTIVPKVAVLAQAASQEAHLRALLRDRQILPAVPGAQTILEVGELSLEVTVTDVAPPPEAGSLRLDRVRLALTPFRYPQRPASESVDPGASDGSGPDDGWPDDAGPDDEALRPPLPFRREDG